MKSSLVALIACIFVQQQTSLASTVGNDENLDFGIFEWIHSSEGGYYNPKQEFRRQDPDKLNSLIGVFAKERIEKDELLCEVPWNKIVYGGDYCGTVDVVVEAMRQGEKSEFAPYAVYLNAQRRGQLPTAWSEAGKSFLNKVLGVDSLESALNPRLGPAYATLVLDEWYVDCADHGSYVMDDLWQHGALLAHQRADDDIMIPAYDMYNHQNGKWTNAKTNWQKGEPHVTKAARTIEAGEQICISYDKCPECGGRRTPGSYGTDDMLRDYGFVEALPQRWKFMKRKIIFDMDEDESGELTLEWHKKPKEAKKRKAESWLQKEIDRLTKLDSDEDHDIGDMLPQEIYTIHAFIKANILAMTTALKSLQETDESEEEL
mmetsp:Transcript_17543/g.26577  ORF Transcript_17543/g.26577 Transcript_17543/m.26577 type:complete len:375 (-) Transcript_17543:59-1183(-)|eukprot:CAMPEP_0194200230 /NCGR_PEP_ID=MMETSP0156-20130528/928_1 /TAXON_ID=33649 /ORGANISM="Thalassionema nitzschioides, Strain L26-B" /LENGTH=374 /DNA_ID=CAMNT_0038925203 /DNA_START=127 /DNA_END=1251 /DNA_ORIENTATION=+